MKVGNVNRRTAAQFILLGWAVALAWLATRELGKDEAATISEATIRLSPEAHFFSVKAADQQIGYASVTIDTLATGFKLSEVMALDVPEADSIRRVTRRTELVLSRSLRLRSFTRTVTGSGLFEEFTGQIEGDTVLRMGQRDARDRPAAEWTIPVPGDVVLAQVLPYRLAFGKRLEVGRSVSANVLDLATGIIGRVDFSATAESTFVVADSAVEQRQTHRWRPVSYDTVRAWRIEHAASGTPVVTWVDARGGLVQTEAALGVRLERSAFELVTFNYRSAVAQAGPDGHRAVPAMQSAFEAHVALDTTGASAYRIDSDPIERFLLPRVAWLAGGRQTAAGNQIQINEPGALRADSAKSDYLDPNPTLRPVTAIVAAVASRIAPTSATPMETVRALVTWIWAQIRSESGFGAPRMPEHVFESRRAGPEGKAALFVDFARTRGLSARAVSGVAVVGGRIFGHAWAEVRIDGTWLAVDPTFGQVPASPRLIRISVGGSGQAIDLVPILGSARITPVEPTVSR